MIQNYHISVVFLQIQTINIFCKKYYFYKKILTNLVLEFFTEEINSVLIILLPKKYIFSNEF